MCEPKTFLEVAERFCDYLEHADELSLEERVGRAVSLLGLLVAHGAALPETDSAEGEPPSIVPPSFSGFGDVDLYPTVFDPLNVTATNVTLGSLIDDMFDIYTDLRAALWLGAEGQHAAIWYAKLMFPHWGKHATGALHVLCQLQPAARR
jgi:hypothetical protein